MLVNNAGITHRSAFAATDTAVLRRVVEVNLFGAIHLTRAALPELQRARGLIVTLSSVAGFTPLIARTGYAASKHALHGFFESLRTELAPRRRRRDAGVPLVHRDRHRPQCTRTDGRCCHARAGRRRRPLRAAVVADRIVHGASRSRRLLLIGRTAHAAWWLSRLAPALYERIMARRLRDEMAP